MSGLENGHDTPATLMHQQPQGLQGDTMPDKPMDEPPAKDTTDPWENFDAQAAFLGPTLWDKRLPYDGQDFKVGVITHNGGLFHESIIMKVMLNQPYPV